MSGELRHPYKTVDYLRGRLDTLRQLERYPWIRGAALELVRALGGETAAELEALGVSLDRQSDAGDSAA